MAVYEPLSTTIYNPLSTTIHSVLLTPDPVLVRPYETKGAFVWAYSIYSYSGVGITEHTEYHFPKEKTLC